MFAKLARGSDKLIQRVVGADEEPSDDVLTSMERELRRAAGMRAFEG